MEKWAALLYENCGDWRRRAIGLACFGTHSCNQLCAMHKGKPKPHELVALNRNTFNDDEKLYAGLIGADAVLHFAGINRGRNEDIEAGNPEIARRLSQYCMKANVRPHVVHSNSTQSVDDTPYGRSKRIASEILSCIGGAYTDLILPNLFGEGLGQDIIM